MSGPHDELTTAWRMVHRAVLDAARFERQRVWWRSGAITVLPVLTALALTTGFARPVDVFVLGLDGLLVGLSWLAGDGPAEPPVATMAVDVVVVSLTTFLGMFTGGTAWLHLALLGVVCLIAGMASAVGRKGFVVGTHGVIAYVILGAFPEPVGSALRLAGLALAAGALQVWFVSITAAPLAYRRQRAALAVAYRRLAVQARAPRVKMAPSSAALEEAELRLSQPALFADPELPRLVALAGEGRRIQLELTALATAMSYAERESGAMDADALIAPSVDRIARALERIASALSEAGPEPSQLIESERQLGAWGAERPPLPWPAVEQHLAGLTGQVSAAARQVLRIYGVEADGWGSWSPSAEITAGRGAARPSAGSIARIAAALRADLRKLRDSARLDAAAGRHAVRLAIAVTGTALLAHAVNLPHGSWAPYAAAGVLRPGFGATFTRGTERVLGTCLGVVLATLIAVALQPSGWSAVAVAGALLYLTFSLFPASFSIGVATMTAAIVFLMHAISQDSAHLALYRGLDTLIGGSIGLAAFALWPTWSGRTLPRLLSVLVAAQRDYLAAVLRKLERGEPCDGTRISELAHLSWLGWADVRATLAVARSEPVRVTAPDQPALILTSLERLVFGVHALRLAASDTPPAVPHPELTALGTALTDALTTLQRAIGRPSSDDPLPPLRALYRAVPWSPPDRMPAVVRVAFDELIDAINSLASALGC